ncbi:MAG: hypothetical protein II620_02865 [Paludibacteraceae bacterium]|nr:hypothetical protein [Paludibacteraceae bacterium]
MRLKTLLLTTFAAAILTSGAVAQTNTWNEQLSMTDSKCTSSPHNIVTGYDGAFFTLANYLTTGGTQADVTFFGYTLPQVSVTNTNSPNHNMVLVKHNINGEPDWAVYSAGGYVDVGNTEFIPTTDGGVVMIIKARHTESDQDGSHVLITLKSSTDNTGKTLIYNYQEETGSETYKWIYQPVLAKISADGKITALERGQSADGEFSFYGAATDGADNMYVAAAMIGELKLGDAVIPSQERNSGVLLKFSSNLQFSGSMSVTGNNEEDKIQGIVYGNGSLYTMGVVASLAQPMSFGGKTVSSGSVSGAENLWVSKVNPETLTATTLNVLENKGYDNGTKLLYTTKLNAMTIANNSEYAYICGAIIGEFDFDNETKIAPMKDKQMGFVVRMNTSDGSIKDGFDISDETTLISQVFSVIDNTDSLYVWGYDMAKNAVKFQSRNRATFAKSVDYKLYSNTNTMTTIWPCVAFDGSKIILPLRAKTLVTPTGSSESYGNTTNFYSLVSGFDFGSDIDFSKKGEPTTVEDNISDTADVKIYASNGVISIEGAEGEAVAVFNIAGAKIASISEAQAHTQIPVNASGLYIVKTNSKSQKVLVSQ